MNKATIVYIVMLAAAIGGLWGIIAVGKHLRAPTDLAGKWQLASGPATQPSVLTIEQSGHFFQASLDDGPAFGLGMIEDSRKQIGDKQMTRVSLANSNYAIDFQGPADSETMTVMINRPRPETSGQWIAKRIVRTFAADAKKSGGGH